MGTAVDAPVAERIPATRRLDLDDVGPQPLEEGAGVGPGQDRRQLEHPDASQRCITHHTSPPYAYVRVRYSRLAVVVVERRRHEDSITSAGDADVKSTRRDDAAT
jgi:hypothetical protein